MKLKVPQFLSGFVVLFFALFIFDAIRVVSFLLDYIDSGVFTIAIAAIFIIANVLLKVARTTYLINYFSITTFSTQFRGICIGYLFDWILPLRLGQVVRAYYTSYSSQISFGFSILAVLIEKVIDVFFMTITILFLTLFLEDSGKFVDLATIFVSTSIVLAFVFIFTLVLRQQKKMHSNILSITNILNEDLSNQVRYSVWSSIYGFQKIFRDRKFLLNYLVLSFSSWLCYLCGVFLLIIQFNVNERPWDSLFSIFAENNIFTHFGSEFFASSFIAEDLGFSILFLYRQVAYLPFIFLGFLYFVQFLVHFDSKRRLTRTYIIDAHVDDSFLDKKFFIQNYFANDPVYVSIHRELSQNNYRVEKFFSGGSDAITLLVRHENEVFVRKCISLGKADKLKSQYLWLASQNHSDFVKVTRDGFSEGYYFYDMEYLEFGYSFFSFIHRVSPTESAKVLREVYESLQKNVYLPEGLASKSQEFNKYLETNLFARCELATSRNAVLNELFQSSKLVINGRTVHGFTILMEKIMNDVGTMQSLQMINESRHIHGDLTIDNILIIESGQFVIIDPSDDNCFTGPLIDFARTLQSLKYGYEFLVRDQMPPKVTLVEGIPQIDFIHYKSVEYATLENYFSREIMPKILDPVEVINLDFHVAVLFFRMLPHQNRISEQLVAKYFATGIIALNNFVENRGL